LDVKFEVFDEQDYPHKLTVEEVRGALDYSINPLTGEEDPDIRSRVAMYFAPTAEMIASVSGGTSAPEV
jgi:hypothetical protein